MTRTPVASSDIRSIGYDSASQLLEIEFHNGGIYQYYSIPQSVYRGLMSAASHGRYFHAYIKNAYAYRRLS